MPNRRRLTTLAILTAVELVGCAAPASAPTADAGPPQTVDSLISVPPGAVIEGTWDGRPGDALTVALSMSDPVLDWDIHTHDDGATQTYVVEFNVSATTYTLRPTRATTWYVLVKNAGTTVEQLDTHLELTAGTTWRGWP